MHRSPRALQGRALYSDGFMGTAVAGVMGAVLLFSLWMKVFRSRILSLKSGFVLRAALTSLYVLTGLL